MTAASSPALGSPIASFTVGSGDSLHYVDVDITTLVQDWASGNLANNGLALRGSPGSVNVVLDTKESVLFSHGPELEVALTGVLADRRARRISGSAGAARPTGHSRAAGIPRDPGPRGTRRDPGSARAIQAVQGDPGTSGRSRARSGPQGNPGQAGAAGPPGPEGPAGPGDLKATKAALLQWYRQDFPWSPPPAVAFDGANIWVANAAATT